MPSTPPAIETVLRALERGYREAGAVRSGVLLAVSGGADSTALLLGSARLAGELSLSLEVACLDHGLRPEAQIEIAEVGNLAARLGLPFHTRALGLAASPAFEERARRARYAALEGLRAERGLAWIATAHTASDQAETLLMRLSRGASLKGAAGVLPRRGEHVIRPLLGCTRAEVEAFLEALGQGYARDAMNEDRAFLRIRFRKDVLPALVEAVGPSAVRHLADFAELAREDEALLSELARDAWRRLALGPGALDAAGVRALLPPLRRRVVAMLLEERGLPVELPMVRRTLRALERGGRAGLARGWEVRAAGGVLRCARPSEEGAPAPAISLGPGEQAVDLPSGLTFEVTRERPAAGTDFIELDASAVLPLTVRRRRPGDRVMAGGVGRSRKLQDLLVDLRVRAEERDRLPVVADRQGRVLWVPGVWRAPVERGSGWFVFVHLHAS